MRDLSVITRSLGHSQRVMAQRSKYVYATYYGKILRYPMKSILRILVMNLKRISYEIQVSYVCKQTLIQSIATQF